MKRLLTMVSLVFVGLIAVSCYDDSSLWESVNDHEQRIKTMEQSCDEMNAAIASLKTLLSASATGDPIVSVEPLKEDGVEVGYTLTFASGKTVTIRHGKDGADGNVPQLGAAASDGELYWTLDGKWVLDPEGNKIPVAGKDGRTPEFKIEDGVWHVTYDGTTWEQVPVTGGAGIVTLFTGVSYDESHVYVYLSSGEAIVIPRSKEMDLIFPYGNEIAFFPGESFSVEYKLIGGNADTKVAALTGNGWSAYVEAVDSASGYVHVTAPLMHIDGEVVLLVSDGADKSFIRTLVFTEGSMTVVNDVFELGPEATTVEVSLATDLNYYVYIDPADSWITLSSGTKAEMREETVVFDIAANNTDQPRGGTVYFINNNYYAINSIYVYQEAGTPSESIVSATVAEFLAAEEGDTWYQLTGQIANMVSTSYGNFDLVDETGSVYVYGLTATQVEKNDKSFSTLGLAEGDVVTLVGKRTSYKGVPQVGGPAYYVSSKSAE